MQEVKALGRLGVYTCLSKALLLDDVISTIILWASRHKKAGLLGLEYPQKYSVQLHRLATVIKFAYSKFSNYAF